MAHLDEYLRDIEVCRIPELRAQLEPLESGKIRIGEISDGRQSNRHDAGAYPMA